jgi:peptide/nickel transport system ATP-binding protein
MKHTQSDVMLIAEGIGKVYGHKVAVDSASLTLEPGVSVGVVGESGSGKSTLGRMLVGLTRPTTGVILYNGRDLSSVLDSKRATLDFRRHVQLVQQDTSSSFDPRQTILTSLRIPAQLLAGHDRAGADAAIAEIIHEMKVRPELLDRHPSELSGGQRQRMSIARALVVHPRLIVCDEAISALDVSVQARILNLLKRYNRDHQTGMVFISHQLPATAFITSDLVVMYQGQIVEHGPTNDLLESPRESYTASLVGAYRELSNY